MERSTTVPVLVIHISPLSFTNHWISGTLFIKRIAASRGVNSYESMSLTHPGLASNHCRSSASLQKAEN